ncbi:FSD1-like protein isoform X1 [Clavelina lepadiformis]|uniref:FSD1-like protein isoform X1 n=1 Tax=Clavelina lepadiformis TaxID=159417 RepID=UPI00404129B7
MEKQKDALIRIVDSLRHKYNQVSTTEVELSSELDVLKESYESNTTDLCHEFDRLTECLEAKREKMKRQVYDDFHSKEEILKNQLRNYMDARSDADQLLEMAKKALDIDNLSQFNQVALSLKERITMSSIFRLSGTPFLSDSTCHLVADFTREEKILEKLSFLPVPGTPLLNEEECVCIDNELKLKWEMPQSSEEDSILAEDICPRPVVDFYVLQHRQVSSDQGNPDVPWKTVENVKEAAYTLPGIIFCKSFMQIKVQAWNKAVGGQFSDVVTLSTNAFSFKFDASASHGNLKVVEPCMVEWDPTATKPVEARIRSASGRPGSSPSKSASPSKLKSKDRFIGESYTILGDAAIADSEVYFEVTPHPECKTYSVGVTSGSLSRYDQLGRTPNSWCISATKWIQNTFVAKHNNKMKNLDQASLPNAVGIYYNSQRALLAFYNAETKECLYTFKQVKSLLPLVPGFSIWCGSMALRSGLQVPTWVDILPSPKSKSLSVASSESAKIPDDQQ